MPEQWTGDLVCRMHLHRIPQKRLAEALGVTPEYVSMVLNGHRTPPGAQARFSAALERLLAGEDGAGRTRGGGGAG